VFTVRYCASPCAVYLAALTTRINMFLSMLSPLNKVETHEVSGYIISFTLVTTNILSLIASFTTLFPNVSDILSYSFIVTNK